MLLHVQLSQTAFGTILKKTHMYAFVCAYTLWLAILPFRQFFKQILHVLLIEPTLWVS